MSDRRRCFGCVNSIGIVGQTDLSDRRRGLDCVNSIGIIGQTDLSDRRRGLGCVNSTGIVGQTDLSDSIGIVGKTDGRVRQTAGFSLCKSYWLHETGSRQTHVSDRRRGLGCIIPIDTIRQTDRCVKQTAEFRLYCVNPIGIIR